MRAVMLACGLAALVACGASSGDDGPDDTGDAPDAAVGGGGDETDAGDDGVMEKPPPDIIDMSCVEDATQLRLAVSRKFQSDNACYPQPEFDAVIVTLLVPDAAPGETVTFSPDGGGHAYVCPADEEQPCQLFEEGEVKFETYSDAGASGTYSLDGGAIKGLFDATSVRQRGGLLSPARATVRLVPRPTGLTRMWRAFLVIASTCEVDVAGDAVSPHRMPAGARLDPGGRG